MRNCLCSLICLISSSRRASSSNLAALFFSILSRSSTICPSRTLALSVALAARSSLTPLRFVKFSRAACCLNREIASAFATRSCSRFCFANRMACRLFSSSSSCSRCRKLSLSRSSASDISSKRPCPTTSVGSSDTARSTRTDSNARICRTISMRSASSFAAAALAALRIAIFSSRSCAADCCLTFTSSSRPSLTVASTSLMYSTCLRFCA
mmetsp:Transcript_50499/g.109781  ORF Transcript_50499/g.109781 Transcript_50499/m.109781 type:complete len:211 (+) Transcript_50499:498-1130(+)